MKIKIISDGSGQNTKVIDQETGKELENITMIDWHVGIDGMIAKAKVEFIDIPVEIEAELE